MRYEEIIIYGLDSAGNKKAIKVEIDGSVSTSNSSSTTTTSATATEFQTVRLTNGTVFYQALQEGTDITGTSIPAGGASGRGWLSAIWKLISDRLPILTLVNGALKVDGSAVTQPVSIQNSFLEIANDVGNPVPVNGAVNVSNTVAVTGTFYQTTQPVSLVSLPSLATGTNTIGAISNRFNQFAAETQLTTVGVTSSLDVTPYNKIICQYVVANISSSITVRLEGSADGSNFFNLSSANTDTTIIANGTYAFILQSIALFRIRFRFVSVSGGSPTVNVQFLAAG